MLIKSKRKINNFNFLTDYSWYPSGVAPVLIFLLVFILGGLILSGALAFGLKSFGLDATTEPFMLISYILLFIPALLYAKIVSAINRNKLKEAYKIDDFKLRRKHGLWIALSILFTLALGIALDLINFILPPIPDYIKKLLEALTNGNAIYGFVSICILAPLLEEWLCRGMILRSLLHYKAKDGSTKTRPALAIVVSASIFALIHFNIWQGIPAFVMGLAFGLVYYKTGSLKLTILMHFVNNCTAFVFAQIPAFKDSENLFDMFSGNIPLYCVVQAIALLIIGYASYRLTKTPYIDFNKEENSI